MKATSNRIKIGLIAVSLVLGVSLAQAGNISVATSGDWGSTNTWNAGALPGSNDTSIVNNNRTLTHSTGTHVVDNVRVSNQADKDPDLNGYFIMSGGDLSMSGSFFSGAYGSELGSTTMTGGNLSAGHLIVGGKDGNTCSGEFTISGGTLDWGGVLKVGEFGDGMVTVDGTGANSMSGTSISLYSGAALIFKMGVAGVSALTASNQFGVYDTNATLTVDGANYTGGAATISLVYFDILNNSFESNNISLINFSGLNSAITCDEDSMDLVLTEISTIPTLLDIDVGDGAVTVSSTNLSSTASSNVLQVTSNLVSPSWSNIAVSAGTTSTNWVISSPLDDANFYRVEIFQ